MFCPEPTTNIPARSVTNRSVSQRRICWSAGRAGVYVVCTCWRTRYDGYRYKSYFNDPVNPNSLANDWVEALCADHNGFIWIGTRLSGLDRLDPTTGHFTHFRHDPKNTNTISSDIIEPSWKTAKEYFGLVQITALINTTRKKACSNILTISRRSQSLSCNHVFKLYEDRQGTLWVGTGSIWYGEGGETDEGGLNRLDKSTGKFIRYLHEPGNSQSLIDNKVRAIFEDSRGTFWIGTAGDGLHTMNRTNGTFERHLYDPAHPEKLSRPAQKKNPSVEDVITFIAEDIAGAIWIGTFHNGVNRYDPRTNKTTYYLILEILHRVSRQAGLRGPIPPGMVCCGLAFGKAYFG